MRNIKRALALALLTMACADAGPEWGGTITDSAGVKLVQNPAEATWTLVEQPVVQEELSIGAVDGAPEYQFGQVAAIDIAEDGRIYVLDQQAAQVRVFDAQGAHVSTFGKAGPGPGELSPATTAILVGPGDTLYVADMMKQRLVRYAPDGSDAGGVSVPMTQGIPVLWAIAPDRRFVTQVRQMALPGMTASQTPAENRDLILLRDPHGEVVDTLLRLESGRSFSFAGGTPKMRLFESEPMWALLTDGRIVHGRNDDYRIEVLRRDGTLERVITRPFQRAPVTETDRAAFLKLLRTAMAQQAPPQVLERILQSVEFADHYPAYARILGGPQNTIWVQHVRTAETAEQEGGTFDAQDLGAPQWDVFDAEGRMLGTLTLPARFQPLRVIGTHLYGVQRDDLDVQHVVRLRLQGLAGGAPGEAQ